MTSMKPPVSKSNRKWKKTATMTTFQHETKKSEVVQILIFFKKSQYVSFELSISILKF